LYDTKINVSDINATKGSSVDLAVVLENLSPSFSISSLQTNITFDSSLVKFDQIVSIGTSTSGWSYSVNNKGNNVILSAAGANGFNSPGIIFKIKFNISPNANIGDNTAVHLLQFLFNEGSPTPLVKDGSITISKIGYIIGSERQIPSSYSISQNFPNPFNPSTVIRYGVPFESNVTIKFYNFLGQCVRELNEGSRKVGHYEASFNASGLASGVYFYSIKAVSVDGKNNFNAVKKMLVLK
jgi:hypothetical protein